MRNIVAKMGLLVGGFIWAQSTSRLTAQEAYKRWKENSKDIILLDVRTPQEYQSGHLRGAQNMDLYADFAKAIQRLPKDRVYFLYCASGRRSAQATEIMRQQGFEAYNIGGYTSAAQAGFPTE